MNFNILSFGQCFIDLYGSKLDQNYVSLNYNLRLGGGSGIFAIACSRFGHNCGLVSTFSTDSFGQFLINMFHKEKVDLKYTDMTEQRTPLEFVESSKSFTDYKFYDKNPSPFKINENKIDFNIFNKIKVFYFTSFILTDNDNYDILLKCINCAKKNNVLIYFNLDFRSRIHKTDNFYKRVIEILKQTDFVISNITDFQQLFKNNNEKILTNKLINFGLKKIIYTYGKKGAHLINCDGSEYKTKIVYDLPAKDRTGAGDIFAAKFICNYMDGFSDENNLNICHKIAAFSTMKYGAIESIPKDDELELLNKINSDDDLLFDDTNFLLNLIDKNKNKLFFSNFLKEKHSNDSLIITQKTYSKIKKYINKASSNIIYMTNSPKNKQSYLPTRLEQLFFIINLFSIKHKGGFILIECLDFLLKHNSLTKVIYFLRQIADLSIMTNIRFALLVDYTKLSDDVIYELKNYQNKFKKAQHHREDSSLIDFKGKFLKSNLEGNLVDVKDKDELFKRIKDTLRDIYDYSFVNIFLFDGNVLVNTNKHAKRRFIHLNSDNIFKKCVDDNREIVINSLNDDLYYKNKKIGDDLETVSTIYFGSDFIPTVIVPVGKEQLLGVVELSKNKKIKLDSEEYNEILYFIKNSFFLAEIFILKEHATKTSKRLKESDELKNNFISMISHELRTPLTSIRGYTSILKTNKNNNFNKNQEDILTIIEKETSNLTSIINDLLDVSKIESGKLDLFLDNENLKDIIKDAIKIMEGFAFEKGVSLEFEKVFKVIVNVDCSRIHQIFTNLLNNAIKFSYPGTSIKINMSLHKLTGKTIKSLQKKFDSDDNNFDVKLLNISNEEVKDFVCVEIGDTGIGIENKNISLLFDKFFQVSNHLTRSTTGTGLGLSIVKYLIELHNGFIDVESEINKGSQFKVYFPLIDEN